MNEIRSIDDYPNRELVEPVLAAHWKLMKFIEAVKADHPDDQWEILDQVRYMIGQKPMHIEHVPYWKMRKEITEHMAKWGLDESGGY